MTGTPRNPWDRQPNETRPAHAALRVYLEQGSSRSLAKVGRELGKHVSLLERWSVRWNWQVRAAAYDEHLAREFDTELGEQRRTAARKHARLAQAAQATIVEAIQNLEPSRLSPADLIRWLDVSVRIERDALGLGQRIEVTGRSGGPIETIDATLLTDEERRARMEVLRREINSRLSTQEPRLQLVEDPR